jgi:long-chain fatty acid transport protein
VSDRLSLMGNIGWEDYSEFGFIDVSIVNSTTIDLTADLSFKDTRHVAFAQSSAPDSAG